MYGAHVVLKTNNGEEASIEHFDTLNTELYDSSWRAQFISHIMMPMMRLFSNLGYVGVAMVGGYLMVQGKLNLGDIQAFIQYLNSFHGPMQNIANISNILQQTAAAAERVFEFLDEEEEIPPNPPKNPRYWKRLKGMSNLRISALAMTRMCRSSTTSLWMSNPVSKSRLLDPPARAKRPWSSYSCAFMNWVVARF